MKKTALLALYSVACLSLEINATASTTLTEETSNNTSASSAFATMSNGDVTPGNVSKLPLRKLIPGPFNGKILAHWMPWWRCTTSPCDGVHDSRDPVRVHYDTSDAAQIDKAITDMISRGYDGVLIAEANTTGTDSAGALAMAQEMHKFPNFVFCVSENHLNKISGASAQLAQLQADMTYANSHYFNLPNYLKMNGKPVVYVFDLGSIAWATASAQSAGHPQFFLDGASQATTSLGGFCWFASLSANTTQTSNTAVGLLNSFYSTVAANPTRLYSGSFFKGFDDVYATWTENRVVNQDCGLTFVRSLGAVNTNLPLIQVATWNDYEEGTEVETGIDNCASVAIRVAGSMITPVPSFTGVGSEETVDHYEAYLSADGVNLLDAGAIPVGGASLDVNASGIPSGTYKAYVQMVGKSHILNHMSSPSEVTIVPSISITSPVTGSTVSNPVTLKINTREAFTVSRIQVWDLGVKIVDEANSPTVNQSGLQFSLGLHTLTINVKDSTLATKDTTTLTFQVK
jgi:hypothetical protein